LGDALHMLLHKGFIVIALIIFALIVKMFFEDAPGWMALTWIGAGTCLALVIWQSAGVGLPLLPLLAIQHFVVYGVPLITGNEIVLGYPEMLVDKTGFEVLILIVACSASWRFGMQLLPAGAPVAHALRVFVAEGNNVLNRVGIALIAVAAGYELLNSLKIISQIMGVLPNGTQSILVAMTNATGMSGYFLVAMFVASGEARSSTRRIFWPILTGHLFLLTSSLLLSSVLNIIGAVVIGLFWGSGRMPRRFLFICAAILSFLNLSKFEMRDRYWTSQEEGISKVGFTDLPAYYWEWVGHSTDKLLGDSEEDNDETKDKKKQTMFSRMNNLQNLLFVADNVATQNTPLLGGETYAIIPPLLIPRILWPEKPRTHEGQIMLNVHFGRQARADSFNTYIAWGLLPEAYGNFGPVWGAVILGVALGLVFAWLETATAAKPLLSLEGMVTFVLFIGIATSFEMVSSVLVTSLFQSVVTISLACLPFVQNMIVIRPTESVLEK
jgi:hypothetical protein